MTHSEATRSIVVGIDGSDAAVRATRWAAREAASRSVPLRLIHIIEPGSEAVRLEVEYAEIVLRTARSAAEFVSRHIQLETEILRGVIDTVLVCESRCAEMICIGSTPADREDDRPGGSTADTLARLARCRVVVFGTADRQPRWGAPEEKPSRMTAAESVVDNVLAGPDIVAILTQIARSVSCTIVDGTDPEGPSISTQPPHLGLRLVPNDERTLDHER